MSQMSHIKYMPKHEALKHVARPKVKLFNREKHCIVLEGRISNWREKWRYFTLSFSDSLEILCCSFNTAVKIHFGYAVQALSSELLTLALDFLKRKKCVKGCFGTAWFFQNRNTSGFMFTQ